MKRMTSKHPLRRAAAVVEMAVVAPVLMLILFGIIEFGWMMTVQNTMVNAAREAVRVGALQGYTEADMYSKAVECLTPMGLASKVQMEFSSASTENPMVGAEFSVNRSSVSLIGEFFNFLPSGELNARAYMRKEGM